MSTTIPCQFCGRLRANYPQMDPTKRCKRCKPAASSKIQLQQVADKTAQHPTRSWWATKTRAEFSANLQRELPRLQAIGADVPKSLRPPNENQA